MGPRVFVGPNLLEVFVWFDANLENVWANCLIETFGSYWSMCHKKWWPFFIGIFNIDVTN